jgi:hypothetical protein
MSIDQTISELRKLGRFCLDQAEQAGTSEGRAALMKMAMNYREAAERLLNSDRDATAG